LERLEHLPLLHLTSILFTLLVQNVALPPEIIGNILEFVENKRDIISVTCTSRLWQVEAERLLYRNLTLKIDQRDPQLVAILKRPELRGPLVVSLCIQSSWHDKSPWNTILKHAKCLHTLKMEIHGPSRILSADYPFALRSFVTNLTVDDNMYRFLASQPSITSLALGSNIPRAFRKTTLPRLQDVSCPLECLRFVLPNRPVGKVHPKGSITEENCDALCKSLDSVSDTLESLVITMDEVKPSLIEKIARTTPRLRSLCLFDIHLTVCKL
jgi:hypothetical protein